LGETNRSELLCCLLLPIYGERRIEAALWQDCCLFNAILRAFSHLAYLFGMIVQYSNASLVAPIK
jgi:hypothetical protein